MISYSNIKKNNRIIWVGPLKIAINNFMRSSFGYKNHHKKFLWTTRPGKGQHSKFRNFECCARQSEIAAQNSEIAANGKT